MKNVNDGVSNNFIIDRPSMGYSRFSGKGRQ